MLAMELSTSRDWAREMRGTASIARAVTFWAVRRSTRSGLSAGARRLARIAPGLSLPISSSPGAFTFRMMSLGQTSSGPATAAPASWYAVSLKLARAPAPASTTTS